MAMEIPNVSFGRLAKCPWKSPTAVFFFWTKENNHADFRHQLFHLVSEEKQNDSRNFQPQVLKDWQNDGHGNLQRPCTQLSDEKQNNHETSHGKMTMEGSTKNKNGDGNFQRLVSADILRDTVIPLEEM